MKDDRRRLYLDLEVGDSVRILSAGTSVLLTLDRKRGSRVKIAFIADSTTRILKQTVEERQQIAAEHPQHQIAAG